MYRRGTKYAEVETFAPVAGVTGLSSMGRSLNANVSLVLTLIHTISTGRCGTISQICV
jgi:hypothetical protein